MSVEASECQKTTLNGYTPRHYVLWRCLFLAACYWLPSPSTAIV